MLTVWLDREMAWQAAPVSGKSGRPATYSDAAVQCCLTMKMLFGLPLRQTQGGRSGDSDAQERPVVEGRQATWSGGTQRDAAGDKPAGAGDLEKWSGYHRRSLVETKMRCFKLLVLGERVMARTFERQVVELQVRAARCSTA